MKRVPKNRDEFYLTLMRNYKHMKNRNIKIVLFVLTVFYIAGCSTKPINLSVARDAVREYYESGKYDEELNSVIEKAQQEFNEIAVKKNSAVIFDVDDTALSNYEITKKMGFGYVNDMMDDWVLNAKATAIPQVKKLYRSLINKGINIIFLTGRKDFEYDATYKNLMDQGYTKFDTLITRRKDEYNMKAVDYKSLKREELTKKGYEIIGTVGDQPSDLNGPYHGIQVKIPNYLYLIK
ncbi:HAD superfamily, subfamily IIIB [bacterium BMS3Abin03]|nr:HAD superfamily, subfamily IIIB [bacterium BMS3Abin03]